MRKSALYILTLLALVLTVPWWFASDSDARILGMPNWAFYALVASALYAAIISFCVGKFWNVSAKSGDGDEPEDEPS